MKLFSLLHSGDIHTSSSKKIIPAASYSQLVDALTILNQAVKDAKTHAEKSEASAKKMKATAKKKGFQEGLDSFNELILDLEKRFQEVQNNFQNQLLTLALQAAKKIVNKELELHPETILSIVQQTIKPLSQDKFVTIFVNRKEKETLLSERKKIAEMLPHLETLMVEEKDLPLGSCVIQTESGMINASIETQWRALEKAFSKVFKLDNMHDET